VKLATRKLLDRGFSGTGVLAILLMTAAVVIVLAPILVKGTGAFVFRATVDFRRSQLELPKLQHGDREEVEAEAQLAMEARRPVFEMLAAYEKEVAALPMLERMEHRDGLEEVKAKVRALLGPPPGGPQAALPRDRYGATRWDRARVKMEELLYVEEYDYSDPTRMGIRKLTPRVESFRGTRLEPLFAYVEKNAQTMLRPRWTFYWRFIFDESQDANMFGGIWPEVLGTLVLTVGAMVFAIPMGVIAAIYLSEYARETRLISLLRSCVSTLAGVPSIVFGLFGLAFFITNPLKWLRVSEGPSVLAGSLTLALLVLPTVIRASEEAIKAVPQTYREAALSLGASKWRTVITVILPAALPGILTGIVISMGRAAGETAPIIFTAAVSVGRPLNIFRWDFWEAAQQPTPALPWNVYTLVNEHQFASDLRHLQFGMVSTLVLLVLVLNAAAIVLRARISRKLKG
jgi:phosphate transport system permease protein